MPPPSTLPLFVDVNLMKSTLVYLNVLSALSRNCLFPIALSCFFSTADGTRVKFTAALNVAPILLIKRSLNHVCLWNEIARGRIYLDCSGRKKLHSEHKCNLINLFMHLQVQSSCSRRSVNTFNTYIEKWRMYQGSLWCKSCFLTQQISL